LTQDDSLLLDGSVAARLFRERAAAEIPRILSWEDRQPLSATSGCFDRTYWCWKFTDFPGARYQEALYALAWFYTHQFAGNPYYDQPRLLQWLEAGFDRWSRLQYTDGSFDEAYPFERSLAATAFTTFYVGEALALVRKKVDAAISRATVETTRRAATWLRKNDERHGVLSNHLAAAAAALSVAEDLCGDRAFGERSDWFVRRILSRQSPEGWFEEYGGADPGYQSHTTFYLARVLQRRPNAEFLDRVGASLRFLVHFVHPNGTIGGDYGSRHTTFYMAAGCEILASQLREAAGIAAAMRAGVAANQCPGPSTMDAQNLLPFVNNYLFAAENASTLQPAAELAEGTQVFREAGLVVNIATNWHAVVGIARGGTFKLYDRHSSTLVDADAGIFARLGDGQVVSSQTRPDESDWQASADECRLRVRCVKVNQMVLSPSRLIALRVFMATIGRWPRMALWVKALMVKILVRNRTSVPLVWSRTIRFTADGLEVDDRLEGAEVREVWRAAFGAAIHMGSSRYFQPEELSAGVDRASPELAAAGGRHVRQISVRRRATP